MSRHRRNFGPFRSWGFSLLLVVSLGGFVAKARAEDRAAALAPERVIRELYGWYVQALMANRDPLTNERANLRRYASDRLIREIDYTRKGPDGLDGDPFVDAQDFDKDWGRNIIVSTPVLKGNKVTAEVELKGRELGRKKLRLVLVQERGGWKVDQVRGH